MMNPLDILTTSQQPVDPDQAAAAVAQLIADLAAKSKRAEQARINGSKSRGPVTAAGKAISSRNALKHGFAAKVNILIDPDDSEAWETHLANQRDGYRPTNAVEADFVDQIASARWRQARLSNIESALIDFQLSIQEAKVKEYFPDEADNPRFHLVLAWQALARKAYPRYLPEDPNVAPDPTQPPDGLDIESFQLLLRYQTGLERQLRSALNNLVLYRKHFAQSQQQPVATPKPLKPVIVIKPGTNEPTSTPTAKPDSPAPTADSPREVVPTAPEVAAYPPYGPSNHNPPTNAAPQVCPNTSETTQHFF